MDACLLKGVRTHNLKGIDVSIPFGKLTVITGVSGSGKSSLAFDTIYAEGQRRFVDCLTTYARQFLERLERPDADFIGHLEPPLALKQTVSVRNARSTVGSMSEIADHLKLLFAHAGETHCAECGAPVASETVDSAIARILDRPAEDRLVLTSPIARDRLGKDGVRGLLKQGYTRVALDGFVTDWPEAWFDAATKQLPTMVEVVVDRFPRRGVRRSRLLEAVQGAWHLGQGRADLYNLAGADRALRSIAAIHEGTVCRSCGARGEIPRPNLFSSNSPLGACPTCQGFGRTITIDVDKVVPDVRRTLKNDAVFPFSMPSRRRWFRRMMKLAADAKVRTEIPWCDLAQRERDWVMNGGGRFPGVLGFFAKLEKKRYKMHIRIFLARFRGYVPCEDCGGTRLRRAALAVTIGDKNVSEINAMTIGDLRSLLENLRMKREREARVRSVLQEIKSRLRYLDDVGLGYLTLDRTARTLSGGETQRLRLAAGLGASLTHTLYVLDEPTVGLHARDASRVVGVLRRICRSGSTALVVEHDPKVIEGADHLIVLGPEGGERGGELIYEGDPGRFLQQNPGFFRMEETPKRITSPVSTRLRMRDLGAHNLKIEQIDLPLMGITGISGVSGSGKSTLVDSVITRNWKRYRGLQVEDVGRVGSIEGFGAFEDVVLVGQEPLGRSTRSNAVSFIKVLPRLRELLASSPEAASRGLKARDFSFNVKGGRCETCRGLGSVVLEMHFLPDVEVTCEVCKGRRFRKEVLEVTYRGRTIQGLLEMTADEAASAFSDHPGIQKRLLPLQEVGLGYLRLGQATSTLSGGEAQRLKLAAFLAEGVRRNRRLIIFDEPTTGLHARDVARLLQALRALTARGDAILVVEHHLDFLSACDWIVDLGPGAGEEGGRVVYEGPVEGLVRCRASLTGKALAAHRKTSRSRR